MAPWLIPEAEKAPEILEAPDGTWCKTDVVTGGKAPSLGAFEPLPELSADNKFVVQELQSGRIGLIGGMQLAFFGDGIEDIEHSFVGTAGIAVRRRPSQRIGFLTNQHIADAPGRRIFHPWHNQFLIGGTYHTKEFATDEAWYDNVVDEHLSYVRCDCRFVAVISTLNPM